MPKSKRNVLGKPLEKLPFRGSKRDLEASNEILTCEKHGPYRRYQSAYSNVTCPICNKICEEQYWRDARRFSYWPDHS